MPAFESTRSDGLNWRWQLLIFVALASAVISRRPDAVLNPQFYAEDGAVWYAQAYNSGWLHSLVLPEGGYLNTLPRLVAGLSLLVPFRSAPFLMNCFGIAFQVLPVTVLLSSRCFGWAPLPVRALQALIYVALPNSREIEVVITNAQWHLALVACLTVLATAPRAWAWKLFDVGVLLLCGLTGPFCILLLPFVVFFWWHRRQHWSLAVIGMLAVSALIQIAELTLHADRPGRAVGHLGASPVMFCRLLAGQVFTAAIVGENRLALQANAFKCVLIVALGILVLLYCCYRCTLELRLFVTFCILLFCASLASPLIKGPASQWQLLANDFGGRYWFFPMLAFLWSVIWLATRSQNKALSVIFTLTLLCALKGILRDWNYPPFRDENFGKYVRQFESARPGTRLVVPVCPGTVLMRIVKK